MLARFFDGAAVGALLLTLAWGPLAFGSTSGWGASGLRLGVALTLLLAAAALLLWAPRRDQTPITRILTPATLFLTLYLLIASLSTLLSPAPFVSQQALLAILSAALGYYLAQGLLRSAARRRLFTAATLLIAAVMAAHGLAQTQGFSFTPMLSHRVSSFFYNPNHYAGFLDLAIPLALALTLFATHAGVRLLAGMVTLALYANLLLSFSRGGWVAVSIASVLLLLLWLALQLRARRWASLLAGLGLLALLAGGGWLGLERFAPQVMNQVTARYANLTRDLTQLENFDRIIILRAGVQAIPDAPLLGVGPGNFISVITRHRPPSVDSMADDMMHRFVNYAHNDYLQVAIETGLFALVAYVGFWLWSLTAAWRAPAATRLPTALHAGLVAGLLALLIHGLVDGNLTVITSNAFWAYVYAGVLHGREERLNTTEASRPQRLRERTRNAVRPRVESRWVSPP